MSEIDIERLKNILDIALGELDLYSLETGELVSGAPEWAVEADKMLYGDCTKTERSKGDSTEWVDGLPEVGRECEVHMHGDQWSKARVVGHDEEGGIPAAVCRVLDSYYAFSRKCIRPLRTEAEKQREELIKVISASVEDGFNCDIADAILSKYNLTEK